MTKIVLVVDDDQDDTEIMTEAIHFIRPSFSCLSFIYPEDALIHIADTKSSTPDYIFLDMQMPRQTGDKNLMALRQPCSVGFTVNEFHQNYS